MIASITDALVGLAYLIVGIRLIRLGRSTGQLPERVLGASFLIWAASYFIYGVPNAFLGESEIVPYSFVSRIALHTGTVIFACFVRGVFRPEERWGSWLVLGTAACLLTGVIGSVSLGLSLGDWEGGFSLTNPWYWVERIGVAAPLVWMATEGLIQHRRARRRARLGLADPRICNRYWLWGLAGLLWVLLEFAIIATNLRNYATLEWTSSMTITIGSFAILPVGVIWLIFFPPASYLRWVEERAAAAQLEI